MANHRSRERFSKNPAQNCRIYNYTKKLRCTVSPPSSDVYAIVPMLSDLARGDFWCHRIST